MMKARVWLRATFVLAILAMPLLWGCSDDTSTKPAGTGAGATPAPGGAPGGPGGAGAPAKP
jgi:hypothetical protein